MVGESLLKEDGEEDDNGTFFKTVRCWNIWFQSKEEDLRAIFARFGGV